MVDEIEVKETFDLFDLKEQGKLEPEVAKEMLNSFGIMVTEDELASFGANASYEKLFTFISDKLKNPNADNLESYFEGIVDKNGKLSVKNFKKYLMNFGLKYSEQEAEEVLKQFKRDAEDNVDWKAFCAEMQ